MMIIFGKLTFLCANDANTWIRPCSSDDVDAETVAARPAEIRFDHRQLNFYRPVTTRSGRRVIRPDYLAGHNN